MHSTKSKQSDCVGWLRAEGEGVSETMTNYDKKNLWGKRGKPLNLRIHVLFLQPKTSWDAADSLNLWRQEMCNHPRVRPAGELSGHVSYLLKKLIAQRRSHQGWLLCQNGEFKSPAMFKTYQHMAGLFKFKTNFRVISQTNFHVCCASMWHHWFKLWDKRISLLLFSSRNDRCKTKTKKHFKNYVSNRYPPSENEMTPNSTHKTQSKK